MAEPLRIAAWPGMPDEVGLQEAGKRIGREIEVEVISSNEDLEKLIATRPPFDLITPSDYLVEKLVAAGKLADLSISITNKWSEVEGWARNPSWDPDERYCLPLAYGTTGLLSSRSRAPGFDSWASFFDPEDGIKVGLLDEVREVVGAALIASGHSPNDCGSSQLEDAARRLETQRNSVNSVSSDDFTGPVERGEVDVHHAWSGPASLAAWNDPDLRYVVPQEGALLWTTTAAVPVDAPDQDAAIRLIHELTAPGIAALAVINGGYSTPNRKVRSSLPADLEGDRGLFPDEETIRRCQTLTALTGEGERAMTYVLDHFSAV